MKKIEKIEELYESSVALIDATDLESINKQENEDRIATIILTLKGKDTYVMGAGNIIAQAALIATILERNKRLMLLITAMLDQ